MKCIAIDARMINASGIGTVIENVLKRLIPIEKEWKFFLLGRETELIQYQFAKQDNVEIIECKSRIYSIREQVELVVKIPKNINILWIPHYNIPLLYKGKMIVTIHDLFHIAMPQFVQGIHRRIYAKFMFHMVAVKANKIICVSQFTANELKQYTDVNGEEIMVIYNGVDDSWLDIPKGDPIHHKPYLLYAGNIKPHKNLRRLLNAFQKIKDDISCDLILVGKKEGFIIGDREVENLARTMDDRVRFTGYVTKEILQQYFKQAEALIYPSLYEGFGLPPLEAMACGCPVIASNVASMPEICGDAVLYCDPYDENDIAKKILVIVSDNDKRTELIGKGRAKYQNFSWDIAANSIRTEMKKCIN